MSHALKNLRQEPATQPIGRGAYITLILLLVLASVVSATLGGWLPAGPMVDTSLGLSWAGPAAPFILLLALVIGYVMLHNHGWRGIVPGLMAIAAFAVVASTLFT